MTIWIPHANTSEEQEEPVRLQLERELDGQGIQLDRHEPDQEHEHPDHVRPGEDGLRRVGEAEHDRERERNAPCERPLCRRAAGRLRGTRRRRRRARSAAVGAELPAPRSPHGPPPPSGARGSRARPRRLAGRLGSAGASCAGCRGNIRSKRSASAANASSTTPKTSTGSVDDAPPNAAADFGVWSATTVIRCFGGLDPRLPAGSASIHLMNASVVCVTRVVAFCGVSATAISWITGTREGTKRLGLGDGVGGPARGARPLFAPWMSCARFRRPGRTR